MESRRPLELSLAEAAVPGLCIALGFSVRNHQSQFCYHWGASASPAEVSDLHHIAYCEAHNKYILYFFFHFWSFKIFIY